MARRSDAVQVAVAKPEKIESMMLRRVIGENILVIDGLDLACFAAMVWSCLKGTGENRFVKSCLKLSRAGRRSDFIL